MKQTTDGAHFDEVHRDEVLWLEQRHKKMGDPEVPFFEHNNFFGLALSGGGVRSATFNLGLLQALTERKILKSVHYLSTVSGGGYVGSTLTWLAESHRVNPTAPALLTDPRMEGWLRMHASYLAPGGGGNMWTLAIGFLASMLVNLAVLGPFFFLLIYLLSLNLEYLPEFLTRMIPSDWKGFDLSFRAGLAMLGLFILFAIVSAIRIRRTFSWRERMRVVRANLVKSGAVLVVMGAIPLVYQQINTTMLFGIVAMGVVMILVAVKTPSKIPPLLSLGLAFVIYGSFLWSYRAVQSDLESIAGLTIIMAVSIGLALFGDINEASMHMFYRDRLMGAYLPMFPNVGGAETVSPDLRLRDIQPSAAPYHIINTTVLTVGSSTPHLSQRGGDSFILSPLYCGSSATGWARSDAYVRGDVDLATAMAISGAAVDPNTSATRSRPLAFLMTLCNARTGYWIRNPRFVFRKFISHLAPRWYLYLLAEMFGGDLDEAAGYVRLTDGGHFDNLGLYELVRRRCRIIVVSDATADPAWFFQDLARVIELVRVDFGAKVELDVSSLVPDGAGLSSEHFVAGEVIYADDTAAIIVYVKTSLTGDESEEIRSFQRSHPTFPDESTANQFFTELQFEAYRTLGYHIGHPIVDYLKKEKLLA